jgi:hypothetical protein
MFTDPSSTIGSGATHGTLGIVLGIGDITRVGGTYIVAGHMIGIGITVMPIITTTTAVHSDMHTTYATDIITCIEA